MLWFSLEHAINKLRVKSLNLPPVRMLYGEGGWNMLNSLKVSLFLLLYFSHFLLSLVFLLLLQCSFHLSRAFSPFPFNLHVCPTYPTFFSPPFSFSTISFTPSTPCPPLYSPFFLFPFFLIQPSLLPLGSFCAYVVPSFRPSP